MKFNFQRGVILCLSTLLSSSILAASPCCNHFYVGANIGIANPTDNQSTNNPVKDIHHLSSIGILGGGLFGYEFILEQHTKLGIEGFFNAINVTSSANQNYSPITSYKAKMRQVVGIRLLPGYEFNPGTTGHILIGFANAKFRIRDNGDFGIINSRFNKNGFQFGLGVITCLMNHFMLRGDIIYTNYASQTSHGITTSTPPGIQLYRNHFKTLESNLSLLFNF